MNARKGISRLVFFICFHCVFAYAQQNTATLTLDKLLPYLEAKYQLVFSYDAGLVKNVPVKADTSLKDINSWLVFLNDRTAFVFQALDKKNVLVRPKSSSGNFLLCGSVADNKTKEALYSAIIYSRKSNFSTACKEDGSFYRIISYVPDDTLSVFMFGYKPVSIPLDELPGMTGGRIYLENQAVEMNEVCITAYLTEGIEYDALDNGLVIHPKHLNILPGETNGDMLASLDALPGISTPDGKAGNLNIRGSTPDQTLITFDNIPLYQKGHLFGTISPFNSNVAEKIRVQRSSMSANKGGRVGGLIEIASPSGIANKLTAVTSASMLDGNVYVHEPVIKNKLSVLVSARQSYPFSRDNPSMKAISDYIFQHSEVSGALKNNPGGVSRMNIGYRDANLKINSVLSEKHKASVSGLYNADDMAINIYDPVRSQQSNSTLDFKNAGVNGYISSDWTSSFATRVSLTHSYYSQDYHTYTYNASTGATTNSRYTNRVKDMQGVVESKWKIKDNYLLSSGYELNYYQTDYIRISDDANNVSFRQDFLKDASLHTVYANLNAILFKKLTVNAGVRTNYYSVGKKISAEPRLLLSYAVTEHIRLKSSAGYQKQFMTQINGISIQSIGGLPGLLWMVAGDSTVPVVNSYQGTFGGMWNKKGWLLDVEGYYKEVRNVSNISVTQPLSSKPFIQGAITTLGVDMLIRKHWKQLDTWASYTLSKSRMQFDSVQPSSFYSLYDQTHVLDIAASYSVKQFKFSLAWKYRTGFAVLPGIRVKMLAGANSAPVAAGPPPGPPPPPPSGGSGAIPTAPGVTRYADRFPAYHSLDASVQYNFPKHPVKWSGFAGITVMNCYNQQNIISQAPIKDQGKNMISNRYMMGIFPNLILSFSF